MAFFRLLTLGFGAGAFGACVLAVVVVALARLHVPEMLGLPVVARAFPEELYRIVVWGGIWGVLLAVPVMNRSWWLKGAIIGVLATVALVVYFHPAVRTPPIQIVYALLLNIVWGFAAGLWWTLVSGTRKNGRKFGTFMR
ncbi:MAG: hypothetical protein KIT16_05550 [Rhodospirillaceae bacterium]|nr:hypothetical protein [Rhodospirillaceae bacterium]